MPKKQPHSNIKLPPQNTQSEQALLGAIMVRPDVMHDIIDIISPESFYVQKHRLLFETMLELFSKNEPIDLLSVSSKLKEKKLLQNIGGMSYLTELVNAVPASGNAKYYAEIIQKKHIMRLLIEASQYIADLGYSEDEDLDTLLDSATKKIFDVTDLPSTQKFVALKEALGEAWERLDTLHQSKDKETRGVPTGFHALDNKLAGLQKSDLIILAARPSVGKTSLALDIARNTAVRHNTPVGYFSLEMSSQQLIDRMLAAESGIDSWRLRTGRLKDDEFERLPEHLERLSEAPIYIDDQPGNNILKMRSVARRLKREKGLELIIVDYLQLMSLPPGFKNDSMVQQVTEISRSLKHLARELNIPVVALSQLSRAVEQRKGRPILSDLRDSGSLEQDADVVMFIHNPNKNNDEFGGDRDAETMEILIEKHRNGPTGKVELNFVSSKATFRSIERDIPDTSGDDDF